MLKSKRAKKVLIIITAIILVIAVGVSIFFGVMLYQLDQIPKMSFEEMLNYTTKNKKDAVITVGIIKNGEANYTVYGNNGTAIEKSEHIYEIGSITKTVTATLIFKAANEDKLNLDDSIDKYLTLPQKNYYPTIKRLLTHTSGYKSHYFESEMIGNFFSGRNDFYGISTDKMIDRIGKTNLKDKDTHSYLTDTHHKLAEITKNSQKNKKMNIQMDYSGAAWVGDTKNNMTWHNGGTGNYNSYLGFDKKNKVAVVVLSNLAPSYRIPATVMGIKLLTDLQISREL